MKKIYLILVLCIGGIMASAQQLPNAGFEDWSGATFDGAIQPASWNASNVTQFGFKFNFAHREAGHSGSYSMMVQDQDVGAAGITETSPGYFSLGQPWVYIESLLKVSEASAGTYGGIQWTHRPDTMAVWIKRTGGNATREDFHLLYYSWAGTAQSSKYKGKNGSCTSVSMTNEESDVRLSTDGNECGTDVKATQVSEGWYYEKKEYSNWTLVKVPIYYMNDVAPTMMNVIFSASNYPNFRANSGLYAGNSLYVDDVQLIYANTIQKLYVDGVVWNGFDPNSSDEQVYALGDNATTVPDIEAWRGAGQLTNSKKQTTSFPGRKLSGSEISIKKGGVGQVTTITVNAEDGSGSRVYKIRFARAASTNANLASISCDGVVWDGFNTYNVNPTITLPYGTTVPPVISATGQEPTQKIEITQAQSLTDAAIIKVTAADPSSTKIYTIHFDVALLADNTLEDILVDDASIPGFVPSTTTYRVSLPLGTTKMPKVQAVSKYPAGEQTIVYTQPAQIDGGTYKIQVSTPGAPTPKIYKLNFKLEASTYSQLKDLQVGDGLINFSPDQYIYYVQLPMGTTEVPHVTYVKGDAYQTVTVTEGDINGTTVVSVKAASGAQSIYKIVFSTPVSSESRLQMIMLDGTPLEGFQPGTRSYDILLTTKEMPVITWVTMDEYETVTMTSGGTEGTTRITVTAGDGTTTAYLLNFSVQKSTNASLQMIKIGGIELEGFDPNITEYSYNLAEGTTVLPDVECVRGDANQDVITRKPASLTGDYIITVRAESGNSKKYTIHFTLAQSDNTKLQMIKIGGVDLEGFDADTLTYTYALPAGVTTIPEVSYEKQEARQKVLNVRDGNVQTLTVTAESGSSRTYTIIFLIQRSESAFLKMIYVGGDSLENFDKNTFDYTYTLKTATCPIVTVDKEDGQQITIVSPYAAGVAKILVQPESGTPNTYTIEFVQSIQSDVQLAGIALNGVPMEDFDPNQMAYTRVYNNKESMPEVTAITKEGQSATVLSQDSVTTIYVTDGIDKAIYTITFRKELSSNVLLANILVNGVSISGWTPSVFNYIVSLPAGSEKPEITYVKGDESQVVWFGQQEEDKFQIMVMAENGAMSTYIVRVDVAQYADADLADLQVEGKTLNFNPQTYDYTLSHDAGMDMPAIHYESKPGQTVMVSTLNETMQQVIVTAENGISHTYTIHYNRLLSSNVYLKDIKINGISMEGFRQDSFMYVDTLEWRTEVVPSIQPIENLRGQIITTYFSSVNGTTRIHVQAPNGDEGDYYIAFPVRKSSNTELSDLFIDHETAEIRFRPNVTEYDIELPYGDSIVPAISYEKAEPEQQIRFISRPMGQTSEIVVIAENGDERVYRLLFHVEEASEPNYLSMIRIAETDQELSLKDKTKREFEVTLPYGSRTMTVEYEKNYKEQTVLVQPGGVNNPTVLTVKSNKEGVADEVYTITPKMQTSDPAVLTDIKVNGTSISGFQSEQFAYIIPVTEKPVLRYTLNKGAEINILAQTSKHWQAEVSYEGRTNVYNVWYYYADDVVPNAEFTEWTNCAAYTSATKPSGWNTIADVLGKHSGFGSFTPNELVRKQGTDEVHLSTQYSTPGGGEIPGFITLGSVSGSWGVAGSSNFAVSGGISFHNSPDIMQIRYYNKSVQKNSLIQYILTGSDGTYTMEHKDNTTASSYKVVDINLGEANRVAGEPTLLNIVLDSYYQISGTILSSSPEMYIDWLRFSFNHTLTGMQVNGVEATKSDKAFSYTLADAEAVETPILSFTGEVEDQAQSVTWSAETKSGEYAIRNAAIRNYAENGTDYTDYTLEVKRPLCQKNNLTSIMVNGQPLAGFAAATTSYDYHMTSSDLMPDVVPVAASSRQKITTSLNGNDFVIEVTPEYGAKQTYTIHFIVDLSSNTELSYISDVENFVPATRSYSIVADAMPELKFTKHDETQTVVLDNGVLTVTAEDGTQGTYQVNLVAPEHTTSAQLASMELNGNPWAAFNSSTYEYVDVAKPELTAFQRVDKADSVIYTQRPEGMEWQVIGLPNTTQHTYSILYHSTVSDNSRLKGIYVNGALIENFDATQTEYTLYTDSAVQLSVEKMEDEQELSIQYTDYTYSIMVTAADHVSKTDYTLTLAQPLSDEVLLQSIMLDSVEIAGFRSDSLFYSVVLPVGAVKKSEPMLPSLQYVVKHPGQKVEVTTGRLNESTYLTITSQNGKHSRTYEVLVNAEPSHNAELSGIVVNGQLVERFEPGRHYYSMMVQSSQVTVEWASEDLFQTAYLTQSGNEYTIHVTAQDGIAKQDYVVEVFREQEPNDAKLKNILLNGIELSDFEPALNHKLAFDPDNNTYLINLPAGTTILPEVSAQLKMDGQSVEIQTSGMFVYLTVTAKDGVSKVTYNLEFAVPLSFNANLDMIYLDGEAIADFVPNNYYYLVEIPAGQHAIPALNVQKAETAQQVTIHEATSQSLRATIEVIAEDGISKSTYTIVFSYVRSENDMLDMIFLDGDSLPNFAKDSFNYVLELEVGKPFPDVTWYSGDEYQTITMDTVSSSAARQVQQIRVVAENGFSRVYTLSFEAGVSSVDTLKAIYVNSRLLPDFNPYDMDYSYIVPSGTTTLPNVEYEAGDEYQVVTMDTLIESTLTQKSMQHKIQITTAAPSGKTRRYTIHFPMELSSDTLLSMIWNNGQPLANFANSLQDYTINIPYSEDSIHLMPAITVTKNMEEQNVDIVPQGDSLIIIRVVAENGVDKATYRLTIQYGKSPSAKLSNILVDGLAIPSFHADTAEYTIRLFTTDDAPEVQFIKENDAQILAIDTTDIITSGIRNLKYGCVVTSADGEHDFEYTVTLDFSKTSIDTLELSSHLKSLMVHGKLVNMENGFDRDFCSDSLHYVYRNYPQGVDASAFFDTTAITFETIDQEAFHFFEISSPRWTEDSLEVERVISLHISDHFMLETSTYTLTQRIALSHDSTVVAILLDGKPMLNFDPDVHTYTYMLKQGITPPSVSFLTSDTMAFSDVKTGSFDPQTSSYVYQLTCMSQYAFIYDKSNRMLRNTYDIEFKYSDLNESAYPNPSDLLVKRIAGSYQVALASLRSNVQVFIYDITGQPVFYRALQPASPSNTITAIDGNGNAYFSDVNDLSECEIVSLQPNKVYFYCFFQKKKKIHSGKLVIVP